MEIRSAVEFLIQISQWACSRLSCKFSIKYNAARQLWVWVPSVSGITKYSLYPSCLMHHLHHTWCCFLREGIVDSVLVSSTMRLIENTLHSTNSLFTYMYEQVYIFQMSASEFLMGYWKTTEIYFSTVP